jgi:hypothetical protein
MTHTLDVSWRVWTLALVVAGLVFWGWVHVAVADAVTTAAYCGEEYG